MTISFAGPAWNEFTADEFDQRVPVKFVGRIGFTAGRWDGQLCAASCCLAEVARRLTARRIIPGDWVMPSAYDPGTGVPFALLLYRASRRRVTGAGYALGVTALIAASTVIYALTRRGGLDLALGRWGMLAAGAREALDLAQATGRPALEAMPRAWVALVGALRGEDDADLRLRELEQVVATGPLGSTGASVIDQVSWARAVLADTPAAALHHYEQMGHGFAERLVALERELSDVVGETRKPLRPYSMARSNSFSNGSLPQRLCISTQAETQPGTLTLCQPRCGMALCLAK